jgi:hypothetical protein
MTKESRLTVPDPKKPREPASWYRELAERSGNPAI